MQREMATIEQVAQDNHERARRLMRELNQMQREYVELRKQVRPGAQAQAQAGRLERHELPPPPSPGPPPAGLGQVALLG